MVKEHRKKSDNHVLANGDENDLCMDLDMQCASVTDKCNCWLDAPHKGICPFLGVTRKKERENA